jgi:protein-tyrosine phosphatase
MGEDSKGAYPPVPPNLKAAGRMPANTRRKTIISRHDGRWRAFSSQETHPLLFLQAGKSAYASDLILFGEPIQNVKDEQSFRYRDKNIPDLASSNLKNMFPETTAFIRSVLASGGKVLIHCMMGVSRSTSALIAVSPPSFS